MLTKVKKMRRQGDRNDGVCGAAMAIYVRLELTSNLGRSQGSESEAKHLALIAKEVFAS
jgi:hypothetical protein